MKITLELPDTTTSLGLFVNVQWPNTTIATTNWLAKPKDGMVLFIDPKTCKITERKDETDDL